MIGNSSEFNHRPLVVLGAQRSGTSATAGALARLGAFLGKQENFFPADANNPAGYFEERTLSAFNHKCLAHFQMRPVSLWPLPSNWQSFPQADSLKDELRTTLARFAQGASVWGFKQPIATLIWPIYEQVFADLSLSPQFVVCVRNPIEIRASGESLQNPSGSRQLAPLKNIMGSWVRDTLGALEAARGHQLTLVPYSRFVESPSDYLRGIVSQQGNWHPSDEQWNSAFAGIRPDLRHQKATREELASYPSIVGETLDYCLDGGNDSTRLETLIAEFNSWLEILEPPKLAGTRMGFAWNEGANVRSAVEPFMPRSDWQTVRLSVNAPPNTELHGLLYNKPCRCWIKRAVFIHSKGEARAAFAPGPGSQVTEVDGLLKLDGAYEPRQLSVRTPSVPGPYVLEMELLLESGPQIVNEAAARLADRLHRCAGRRKAVESQLSKMEGTSL